MLQAFILGSLEDSQAGCSLGAFKPRRRGSQS